jgi:hypothetical protein
VVWDNSDVRTAAMSIFGILNIKDESGVILCNGIMFVNMSMTTLHPLLYMLKRDKYIQIQIDYSETG